MHNRLFVGVSKIINFYWKHKFTPRITGNDSVAAL